MHIGCKNEMDREILGCEGYVEGIMEIVAIAIARCMPDIIVAETILASKG